MGIICKLFKFQSYTLKLLYKSIGTKLSGMIFRRSSTKFPHFLLIGQKHVQHSQLLLQIDQYTNKIFSSETTVPVETKLAGMMFRRSSTRSSHFIFIKTTVPKGMFLVIFIQLTKLSFKNSN